MAVTGEGQGPALVPGRDCGSCSLCCILPDIAEFDKPANEPCRHCLPGGGCEAYDFRPSTCRDFYCLWRTDPTLGDEWDPRVSRMMMYGQGPQLTVLVEPEAAAIWREAPYLREIEARARALKPMGGYVVVYYAETLVVFR